MAGIVSAPSFHHVGVQTDDLANAIGWYEEFLGCEQAWSLSIFSELTRSRLPGISRLVEVVIGDVRVHLFEREGRPATPPAESVTRFQHVCLSVADPDDLRVLRDRWVSVYESGRFTFAWPDQPTEIVTDDDGVQSFYALDVNGLEFEFTCVPK
jgi:catechol 2,3-dioxygenase-like lactoylglutathione lyase family enzyme